MRLATITNWAYGATVALTLVSGITMLMASTAQQGERDAVAQRYRLDQATEGVQREVGRLTDHVRQYLDTGDATYAVLYKHDSGALRSVDDRVGHVRDAGANPRELELLKDAMRWTDTLHDEQEAAIAARQKGDTVRARQIMFGAEYERELDRADAMMARFQEQLDRRTETEVTEATRLANLWRTTSEVVLAVTGLLFLCVLYFIFKRRVLKPVVRLSDVVNRLAAQDFAVEPPVFGEIDEIGDMAQAICVFRENGLERQRLEQEQNADRAARDLLSRMTQRMQGCDTLLDLKEVVQRFVPEIAPDLAGRLYLVDQARNVVADACNWLDPKYSEPEFSTLFCWALRRGLPHRPSGSNIDVACEHLKRADGPIPDTLCLPLTSHGETLGMLYFEPRPEGGRATPEVYLHMLAENVSLALANLRLRDTLREMAMADPLTGLANRRQLEGTIGAQFADAQRLGVPISCLMIDLDHFKRCNDAYGHEAGDDVLRAVGAVLRHATRDAGHAFRYGGEEFLLVMPGCTAEKAAIYAEHIRMQIGALLISHQGRELGPITASIGVAAAPEHCAFERLIQTADAAAYRAKALGRDRVIVASAPEERVAG